MTKFREVLNETGNVADDREEGEYQALITKAELPRDPDDSTKFLKNSWGKTQCDVTFALDGETSDEHRRRYSVAYGRNKETAKFADFSQLLAAACGIPCGNESQKDLGTEDLEGQWVRVVMKWEQKGEKRYFNVIQVLSPRKGARPTPDSPVAAGSGERFKFSQRQAETPIDEDSSEIPL
jgi:hypothetical protein